jgi:5-amino-6-(5-phospho-D-ribitylamino)uracil phosphatase
MGLKYRFLAIDVDGTLMNSRNELPAATREGLHRAHQAGMIVCLCTGRMLAEARTVLDQIGLDSDVGVFVFGAIVSELSTGRTLHRSTIPQPVAEKLIAHFRSLESPVLVLYDSSQAGLDYRYIPGERNRHFFERWLEISPARAERVQEWRPCEFEPVRIGIIEDPAHIAATFASVERSFSPKELKYNSIFAPNYGLHVVECFAPTVSKWQGIMQVAGPLGIDGSQVVAIGDDINDLEMIRNAGLGVAMGNAIAPIKAAARWHAPTNDECGVAAIIDRILKNEE